MRKTAGEQASAWIVGVMMAGFGLLGMVLAFGARDTEMAIFGWSLAAFGVLFVTGLARGRFGKLALVPAAVQAQDGGDV